MLARDSGSTWAKATRSVTPCAGRWSAGPNGANPTAGRSRPRGAVARVRPQPQPGHQVKLPLLPLRRCQEQLTLTATTPWAWWASLENNTRPAVAGILTAAAKPLSLLDFVLVIGAVAPVLALDRLVEDPGLSSPHQYLGVRLLGSAIRFLAGLHVGTVLIWLTRFRRCPCCPARQPGFSAPVTATATALLLGAGTFLFCGDGIRLDGRDLLRSCAVL